MEDRKESIPMTNTIDAEKTAMYQNFANRRMLIALVSIIIGFIIYASVFVIGYTIRESNWQDTTKQIVAMYTQSGVANEIQPNAGR